MYSRSERKFLEPDADHANPNLGPGSYAPNHPTLIAGKTKGNNGYAPFSSLTPRTSYFDSVITRGPPPGAYAIHNLRPALHNTHKAAEFGKSRAPRFGKNTTTNPGPGTYTAPEVLANGLRKAKRVVCEVQLGSRIHPLTRVPIRGVGMGKEGDDMNEDGEVERMTQIQQRRTVSQPELDTGKPSIRGRVIGKGGKQQRAVSAGGGPGGKIVWRRKHGAPSIPNTKTAFGFQENESGELVPRKPPKRPIEQSPAYNPTTSFAAASLSQNRGPTIPHSNPRLTYHSETPAPGTYDPSTFENFYKKNAEGAVMTLAPCSRFIEEVVKVEKRKGVPGPGAYEVKIIEKGKKGRDFKAAIGHLEPTMCGNTEQIRTPGPGAYYPETSNIPKPQPAKPQPFNSTMSRFDKSDEVRAKVLPAPGSYDVNEVDSLTHRLHKRIQRTPATAFGSIAERFPPSKTNLDPGPGTYDPSTPPPQDLSPSSNSTTTSPTTRPPTRIHTLSHRGPTHFTLGNLLVNPAKAHVPIFGTQTERFSSPNGEIPPPGAYDLAPAYETLKAKYYVPKMSGMVSGTRREVFDVRERIPGPGDYEPHILSKKDMRRLDVGGFLTTDPRFGKSHPDPIPGPGAYLSPDHNSGLLKKTYNITLTDWAKRKEEGEVVAV